MKTSNKAPGRSTTGKPGGDQVSELTTNRLSVYLRCLNALDGAGVRTISSQALAEQFHLNAAQIRKDLAYFGEFGVRGVGYYVRDLKSHLRQIWASTRSSRWPSWAHAIWASRSPIIGIPPEGFAIAALFDTLSAKVGQQSRGGVPIATSTISRRSRGATPSASRHRRAAASAQRHQSRGRLGHQGDLNFSPGAWEVPPDVRS